MKDSANFYAKVAESNQVPGTACCEEDNHEDDEDHDDEEDNSLQLGLSLILISLIFV